MKRISRGLYYEDFEIGRKFEHHWGRTFGEIDALWFSNMTMQYNPIYFNDTYAKALGYKSILINPLFVFGTALGLSVEDLSEAGGAFLGGDDCVFHLPVYVGDTIRSRSVVLSRRTTASRPGWGVVEWKTSAENQDKKMVIEFRRRNLIRMRDAAVKGA